MSPNIFTAKTSAGFGGRSPITKMLNMMWNVYLLKCCDGTVYTGCTNNIEDRLKRHNRGEILYTSTRLPLELVCYTAFTDKYKAFNFEKYLKSGSGKAFANKRLI